MTEMTDNNSAGSSVTLLTKQSGPQVKGPFTREREQRDGWAMIVLEFSSRHIELILAHVLFAVLVLI